MSKVNSDSISFKFSLRLSISLELARHLNTVIDGRLEVRRHRNLTSLDELDDMSVVIHFSKFIAVVTSDFHEPIRSRPLVLPVKDFTDIQHRINRENHLLVRDSLCRQGFTCLTAHNLRRTDSVDTVRIRFISNRTFVREATHHSIVLESGFDFAKIHFEMLIGIGVLTRPMISGIIRLPLSISHSLVSLVKKKIREHLAPCLVRYPAVYR